MKRQLSIALAIITALIAILAFFALAYAASPTPFQANNSQNLKADPISTKIHPALLRAMLEKPEDSQIAIIIEWRRNPDLLQTAPAIVSASSRAFRRKALVETLKSETERNVGSLVRSLRAAERSGQTRDVREYWISPIISLKATPQLIESLASRDEIVQIRLDQQYFLSDEPPDTSIAPQQIESYGDNLTLIQVNLAQQALGLDGSGVVVASLDTGVDWQHPALMKKYRGYNPHGPAIHAGNWYVVTGEPYLYPGDGYGHGTHTMGTIVGDDGEGNRIGVAPGAKWIAVKLFTNQGYTYESWIHAAFQWILAPNGDPNLAPDVVNNSWGSTIGSDDRYRLDIAALRVANILPVFSAGNSGPNNGTIASPASYPESLAVGAVDQSKEVASFSSRGPSIWGEIKPEVSAPGVAVRSAYPGGGYAIANGTSQAAPHVTGLAALLLQANPSLTPDELESIIFSTAEPLGSVIPNNSTGWGLINAYAAGLLVTSHGSLQGIVLSANGSPIPAPIITASPRDSSGYTQTVTISGNPDGTFSFALLAGRYDITASAFGFADQIQYLIEVVTGGTNHLVFNLSPLPVASVFGLVTDLQNGAPLSATLKVRNTPLTTQTDPASGAYSLALPQGIWQIDITAPAHRTGHITPTVVAGNGYPYDISLPPSPRILLVDSGRWYYESQIKYFEDELNNLDYPYSLWPVRNPFGEGGQPSDLPVLDTFLPYDLVIWSAPQDSPGLLGMNSVITQYLSAGGNLLVSGQEIAYLDASYFAYPQKYLTDYLGIWFSDEGNLSSLTGTQDSPLYGLSVELNTPDSAQNQFTPDSVTINDPIKTHPALKWSNDENGAVLAGVCQPYRAGWLGFGYEGAGPQPTREELLDRLINWLVAEPEPYAILVNRKDPILIGPPGTTVSGTLVLHNLGVLTDTYNLQLEGEGWNITIELPSGQRFTDTEVMTMGSCTREVLTYSISIPNEALRNDQSIYTLTVASQSDLLESQVVTLAAKTPAPLLLTDDERWYNHEDKYIRALQALGLPFDYIQTSGDQTPSTDTLKRYPITLWTTGYDWYAPLTSADEQHLAAYLDGGGGLLLTSQDLMDVRGNDEFVQHRLGVVYASYSITPTTAIPTPDNELGIRPEYWPLLYPFKNWSDGLWLTDTAKSLVIDPNLYNMGVIYPASNWRTAFFSFPLETLEDTPLETLLANTLLWISPFGESRLATPPAAAAGSQVPISLTLGLARSLPLNGLKATVPLPPKTNLVPGSVWGSWIYDSDENSLIWEGDLTPGITLTLGASLELDDSIPPDTTIPLSARFYDQHGLVAVGLSPIRVGVPWITIDQKPSTASANIGNTVAFTLTILNHGPAPTSAALTHTLPSGLKLITDTLTSSSGSDILFPAGFKWSGELAAQSQTQINFQAIVDLLHPGTRLKSQTTLSYPNFRLFSWNQLIVPAYIYLPWVGN